MDPQITHTSLQLGYKSKFPTSPPQIYNLLEQFTELRKAFTYTYQFIIKDTRDGQLEQMHKARYSGGGVWSFQMFSGNITLPEPPCAHQPRSSSNCLVPGAFIVLNLQPPHFLVVSRWGWKFQPCSHLVLPITSPVLSHFISINSVQGWSKDAHTNNKNNPLITQEIPRLLGSLCQEPGIKIKYVHIMLQQPSVIKTALLT